MRYAIIAALFVAACTTAAASGGQTQSGGAATASTPPNYSDARSTASDDSVRDARRAYRGACEQHYSTARCECLTGTMAQVLPPADLAIATAGFTGASVQASAEARGRVNAAQSQAVAACTAYPH